MSGMYKRTCEIIKIIDEMPNKFDIKELSQVLGVSIKTVQGDIQEIDEYFKSQKIASLETVNNKFSIRKINKSVYEALSFYDYKLSKDERLIIETLLLIFTSEHITLSNMAEFMYVSRSTVIGDLKCLNKFLNCHGLSTDSQSNTGICISGSEINVRDLFVNILRKKEYLYVLFSHQDGTNSCEVKANDREENIMLQNLTSEAEGYSGLQLTECSFNMLVNYLNMMIFRIKSGKYVSDCGQKCRER